MPCFDAESLAAFVDGRLPSDERPAFEAHLASCDACYEALRETALTLRDLEGAATEAASGPQPVAGWRRLRHRVTPLLLAASVALAAGIGFWATRGSALDAAVAELADAPRAARFSPGRLSVDREWRPTATLMRAPLEDAESLEVRSAARSIEALTASDSSPEALHARGLARLAGGDLAGSLADLERAAESDPRNPTVQSDLGAACLERFRRNGDPRDASRALQLADAALAISPRAVSALFNRAAALEAMDERAKAHEAWQVYLSADPSSAWSAEARSRLSR